MDSKLSRWCNGLMEAGWLATIVAVPLFFNVYSERVFDAEKSAILRSIALIMAVAWLAAWLGRLLMPGQEKNRLLAGWRPTIRAALRNQYPLLLPLLLLLVVYLLSLAFSVAPHISWAGSYRRAQGVYTLLAYLTIAGVTASSLRSRPQWERAVTAVILTSIPIALYASLQRADLDPIPWSEGWQVRVQLRVIGQMGHPIFVAAYLVMAFLLTAGRLVDNVFRIAYSVFPSAIRNTQYAIRRPLLAILLYTLVLILQLLAILWSGSRGPLLGLAAGVGLFVALLVALLRQSGRVSGRLWRRLLAGGTVVALLLAGWLVLFNLPAEATAPYRDSPLLGNLLATMDRWRDQPTIGRFGRLLEVGTGSGRVRVLIWQGMVDLIRPHNPLPFPHDSQDPYNSLRPLLGYGPDTLHLVYNRFYQPEIASLEARNTAIDRAHNETLDLLAFVGLAGLLAWQWLYISLFSQGFRWLGLMPGRRDSWLLAGLWLVGGLLVGFVTTRWPGLPYIGVGYPAGNVLGLFIYLLYAISRADKETARQGDKEKEGNSRIEALGVRERLLLGGLLAAVLSHYIEIQFGIAVVATRTLFFVLVGLFLAVPVLVELAQPAGAEETAAGPVPGSQRRENRPARARPVGAAIPGWLNTILPAALVVGLITAILGYQFVLFPAGLTVQSGAAFTTAGAILRGSWLMNDSAASPAVFLAILATWLLCLAITLVELNLSTDPTGFRNLRGLSPKKGSPAPSNTPPSANKKKSSASSDTGRATPEDLTPSVRWDGRTIAAVGATVGLLVAIPLGALLGLWAGLLLTAVCAAVLYYSPGLGNRAWWPAAGLAWLSLAVGLAWPYFHALQLYAASFGQATGLQAAIEQAREPAQFLAFSYFFILGLLFLYTLAHYLITPEGTPGATASWVAFLVLLPLAFYAIYQSNLRPNQADVIYKQARALDLQAFQARQPALLDQALAVYEEAVTMSPAEPTYRSFMGMAYLQKASITADPPTQELLWRAAETQLEQTADQLPLFPEYQLNLARLHATRARLDADARQDDLLAAALDQYSEALNLSPTNGTIWNEYASVVYNQQDDCDEALALYGASAVGDPFYARTYVEIAALQLACSPDDTPTLTYQEIIARLREALFRISVATTPDTWERLAQQSTDLASFEATLATYEQERSETWQEAKATLDQAEALLTAGNESETDAQLQEALVLFRQLVAQ